MFEAFELQKLVERLPLKICAITTWGDSFMISTVSNKNDAHLLVYQMKLTNRRDYEAKLNRTLKKFTSKPITQLAAIPEHGIFLGLAENEIFFADLEQFTIIGHVTRSRGAAYFSVDWQKLRGQVGFERELRLCVATKKKLYLYQWKKNNFDLVSDLNFPDTPRAAAWVGNNLIICIKKDLYHINMNGDSKEMFSIGATRTEPCLYPLMNGEILVLKDEMQVSLDTNAKPTQPQSLTWSEQPISIEHVQPYILALIPRGIEIRAFEQKILIQSIKPESAIKFITSSKSTLLASNYSVFKLEPLPYDGQVRSCIHNKQFELALSIAELIEETPEEAVHRRSEIMRRLAFHQFTMLKFEESLKNYLDIKENPINVIGLFPSLLPGELRQKLAQLHPTKPPTMSGEELEEGMKHLTNYLTQMRYQKVQELQRHQNVEEGVESQENKSLEKLLKDTLGLIDTTLLKCYIKTGNSTLIGSLVRLPDNYLHMQESERVLRNENYFKELIDLYQSKGQHENALLLLKQFSSGPAGPLMGVWPSIEYLQNLGQNHIKLILEYSKWIIHEHKGSDDPLRIFTEDVLEVKSLPRQQVLNHLEKHAPSLVIPYLEHIINIWGEDSTGFHRKLIQMYQEGVEELLPEYKRQSEEKQQVKAGDEPGMLGVLRTKLLKFLRESQHYVAAEHISSFPQDDLFEERALLLSRLGRHEVALAIYAHVLKEPEMAEEYCRVNYDAEKEDSRDVYLCLIKMYLSPPNLAEFGIHVPEGSQPEANVKDALTVLTQHHHLIDTTKVLDLLPSGTKLKDIQEFLTMVVQERTLLRRRTQLMKSLLLAEHLQVVQQKIRNQAPYFVINDHNSCDACNKRLGTSAFARYPDGTIEHYYCAKEKLTTPTSESTTTVPQETLPLAGGAGLEWTSSSSSDVPVRRDSWSNPFDD